MPLIFRIFCSTLFALYSLLVSWKIQLFPNTISHQLIFLIIFIPPCSFPSSHNLFIQSYTHQCYSCEMHSSSASTPLQPHLVLFYSYLCFSFNFSWNFLFYSLNPLLLYFYPCFLIHINSTRTSEIKRLTCV